MSSLPFAQLPGLDVVYTRIGHGPFHFFSLLAVGFYYVTEGMLNVFTYVVAHAARKQWGLSSIETFFLVIARDIGAISTGLTIPWLGDRFGRLTVIKWGMLCRFTSLMLSTMSLSYHWLLCGLIMVGMSLGFNKPALSCIAIESLPIKSRGALLIGLLIFVIAGGIGSGAMAIYLIPMFKPDNWRTLIFLCSIPTIFGLLAANFWFIEPPRYLAMIGRPEKAVKYLNWICKFNRQPKLSPDEVIIVHSQPRVDLSKYSVKASFHRLTNRKYGPRLFYTALLWFITGYQYTALSASFPDNLSPYTHNPLMPIEIWSLCNAFFVPLPTVEMPHLGRRWTIFMAVLVQAISSIVISLVSQSLLFVIFVIPYVVVLTISLRVMLPYTLELFETSLRCYAFGLCLAAQRFGGLLSRWQPIHMHDGAVSILVSMNFIGLGLLIHYNYETAGKPLEDYTG